MKRAAFLALVLLGCWRAHYRPLARDESVTPAANARALPHAFATEALAPGQALTFQVPADAISTLDVLGDAVEARWSADTVQLTARRPGRFFLRTQWSDGRMTELCIDVIGFTGASIPARSSVSSSSRNHECTNDLDCSLPQRCVRPKGEMFRGVCGQLVDSMGLPVISVDAQGQKCTFDADCPLFFHCARLNALSGVCMK